MTLSDFLAQSGLSQHKFAKVVGVSQNTISRYVNGQRMPRVEHLRRIAEVTGGAVMPTDFVFPTVKRELESVNRN